VPTWYGPNPQSEHPTKKMDSPALEIENVLTAPRLADRHNGTALYVLDVNLEAHGLRLLAIDAMVVDVTWGYEVDLAEMGGERKSFTQAVYGKHGLNESEGRICSVKPEQLGTKAWMI
jgi:hypothetical protein